MVDISPHMSPTHCRFFLSVKKYKKRGGCGLSNEEPRLSHFCSTVSKNGTWYSSIYSGTGQAFVAGCVPSSVQGSSMTDRFRLPCLFFFFSTKRRFCLCVFVCKPRANIRPVCLAAQHHSLKHFFYLPSVQWCFFFHCVFLQTFFFLFTFNYFCYVC